MEDYAGIGLNCTANDVSVADVRVLNSVSSCTPGDMVTILFEADIALATNSRYDIGIFTALDGGDALAGMCTIHAPLPISPDPPFVDLDGDLCGDLDQTHNPFVDRLSASIHHRTLHSRP